MKTKLFIILLMAVLTISTYSQSITNTLSSGGSFIIKDDASTFFTLAQSTGYVTLNNSLSLPSTTSSTLGVIYKGSQSFIHNYQPYGTAGNNTFVGTNSGNFSMTSDNSTGVGSYSLYATTTGGLNSAFGVFSLYHNTEGFQNSASGYSSLYTNTIGNGNSAFGVYSLYKNISGGQNSAFGINSLNQNTTGDYNSACGASSLFWNTTGYSNSAFGESSLAGNTSGSFNTAVGSVAGGNVTTGTYLTLIGANAGGNVTTGSNLTVIGANANASTANATNEITLGNNTVTTLRCNTSTISSLSDARDKKNIKDLQLGIDFLMKLKPRQFNWDRREWYANDASDGSKMHKLPTAGFIAQELDTVQMSANAEWLNLVLKSNANKLEATAGNLLPIIVKAIQDLKTENDQLKAKNEVAQVVNENLKTATDELNARLTKFENMQAQLVAEIEKLKTANDETTKVSLGTK